MTRLGDGRTLRLLRICRIGLRLLRFHQILKVLPHNLEQPAFITVMIFCWCWSGRWWQRNHSVQAQAMDSEATIGAGVWVGGKKWLRPHRFASASVRLWRRHAHR